MVIKRQRVIICFIVREIEQEVLDFQLFVFFYNDQNPVLGYADMWLKVNL